MEFRGHGAVSKLHKRFILAGGLFGSNFDSASWFREGLGEASKEFQKRHSKKGVLGMFSAGAWMSREGED